MLSRVESAVSRAQSSLGLVLCLAGVVGIVHQPVANVSSSIGPHARDARETLAHSTALASEPVRFATHEFNPNSLALGDFGDLDQQ
jgi:hypothetical protein